MGIKNQLFCEQTPTRTQWRLRYTTLLLRSNCVRSRSRIHLCFLSAYGERYLLILIRESGIFSNS